jgi:hypothetical protein
MNHRFIILGISLFIIATIVSGVVYFERPERSLSPQSVVANDQYARLELADVKNYGTATAAINLVVTSGTVFGIKGSDELVLGDGKGNYVLVTFARVDTDLFAPIFSSLRVGDTVEVRGRTRLVQGVLVNSQDGVTIEIVGVNLANAPYFGAISLTSITKIE